MQTLRVIVHGALGKMGQTVTCALFDQPDMQPVAGVDRQTSVESADSPVVPLFGSIEEACQKYPADVVIDFSLAEALPPLARFLLERRIRLVSGTTGIKADGLREIEEMARRRQTGVVLAPNFAIGSVLMMHLAGLAAEYFDSAEIVELHHQKKADAPSGTALSTARKMLDKRGKPFSRPDGPPFLPSRGLDQQGIAIHSVRLPGILARQQVVLGSAGQTLAISHDAISRDCYMPGVIMAIRKVMDLEEMVLGLDKLLGL
jgi:4-hydroxy-tetrahydrodipicolinate reductase